MAHTKRKSDGIPIVPLPDDPLEDLIEALSKRVSEDVSSKIEVDREPESKTFLGSDAKHWGGWFVKAALAVSMAIFAWFNFVNDSIKERPTFEESKAIYAREVKLHELHGIHPDTAKKDEQQDAQIKVMNNILIRTTTLMEIMGKDIGDIKKDIKDGLKRRRGK